ncbi:Lcl C-terminal domain-containing protein [Microbulbifer sp. 2201CG32-9]|uniref:Lcl C-terminal domain-containing protein n=1 Tax=Microbulbifer sp. 2201CG32-9 TaxID=3232309 RepID=UPI00345C57E9
MQNLNVATATTNNTAESANLEWSSTLLDGAAVTHEAAEKAVTELGNGWRLPRVDELATLVDRSRHDPAIDTERFPDTRSRAYWTSTPCTWNAAAVWVVLFYDGYVLTGYRLSSACVRAVRAGQ